MGIGLGAVGLLLEVNCYFCNSTPRYRNGTYGIFCPKTTFAGDIVGLHGVILKSVLDDGRSNLEDAAESAVTGDSAVKLHDGVPLGGGLGSCVGCVVERNYFFNIIAVAADIK